MAPRPMAPVPPGAQRPAAAHTPDRPGTRARDPPAGPHGDLWGSAGRSGDPAAGRPGSGRGSPGVRPRVKLRSRPGLGLGRAVPGRHPVRGARRPVRPGVRVPCGLHVSGGHRPQRAGPLRGRGRRAGGLRSAGAAARSLGPRLGDRIPVRRREHGRVQRVFHSLLGQAGDVLPGHHDLEDLAVDLPVAELPSPGRVAALVGDVQPVAEIVQDQAGLAAVLADHA